ncbi:DUF447 family protein [Ramlibacter sp. USB13]|uniref:DUF447 family protein n=1 Tax=Ramlibacter cellulosilyticus TaxID=2764187 RepID=A0A923MNA7_9BURK|nr:DUF447 domain-containing protein [Ramlibacter cellulosilyticus]MBC5782228.1 DUF447 family protein [Ramlibacter cellulosilyticus]
MSERIFETVVTTCSTEGGVHVAPMGVRYAGDEVVLKPFRPSRTLDNVLATRTAVLNVLTDVRVFAGCVTGRREWPTVPVAGCAPAVRLACAHSHVLLRLAGTSDDAQRPTLRLARLHEVQHTAFPGFNRAQAAVIEGAVLVSRLHLLPREKIDTELAYLQIAIDRTAGPPEQEAWDWLQEAVARHHAAAVGVA